MRTEDLLAACLDAQALGRAPLEILAQKGTAAQRAELEPLLDLAGRLQRLAPPALRPAARAAMAGRLGAAMARNPMPASEGPAEAGPLARPPDRGTASQVHSLAPVLGLSREDLRRYIGPRGEAEMARFLDVPGYTGVFRCLRLVFRGVKRVESLGLSL